MDEELRKKTQDTAHQLFGKGIKMDPPLSDMEGI